MTAMKMEIKMEMPNGFLSAFRRSVVLAPVAVVALTPAAPASAQCAVWKLSGAPITLLQSDGALVQLTVSRKGTTVAGQADYFRSYVGKVVGILSKGVTVNMVGKVDGVLSGPQLDFKISWNNNSTGMYDLRIDRFGRISGTSYDFENPSNRVSIVGDNPLVCFQKA